VEAEVKTGLETRSVTDRVIEKVKETNPAIACKICRGKIVSATANDNNTIITEPIGSLTPWVRAIRSSDRGIPMVEGGLVLLSPCKGVICGKLTTIFVIKVCVEAQEWIANNVLPSCLLIVSLRTDDLGNTSMHKTNILNKVSVLARKSIIVTLRKNAQAIRLG